MLLAEPRTGSPTVAGLFDMKAIAISVFIVAACTSRIEASAQATDIAPANPPRTQQEIMRERRAACRDLKGAEFRECMNNYVGTRNGSAADAERDKRDRN